MRETRLRLAVIIGSIREGRFGATVAHWFVGQAQSRQDLEIQVIDLAETPLPISQQSRPVPEGVYDSPQVRRLAAQIGSMDALVIVTPEYNHGYPGPLKLAIDSINPEWHAKPIGFVSYGGISGGLRAIEQLRLVFAELHAVTVRNTVSFHSAHAQFDADGNPKDPHAVNAAATAMLDQLTWWAHVLRDARAAHPYPA
ncbi:NADPH-dependent FMN reductase [Actinomadura chokoriensis]|uniref:NAD(P)H-dependent oxidoreductase n=1 Tax=Actinomadura chokoriensis TaxID=454156 RepID=A0ABV4QWD2_9ACTN